MIISDEKTGFTSFVSRSVRMLPVIRRSLLNSISVPVLRRASLIGVVGVILILFSIRIANLSYQNYLRDVRIETTMHMIGMREDIKSELFSQILELNQLATVIGQNPDMTETEFNLKALDFLLNIPAVKSVAVAPDNVISMVFPSHGNEGLLGLDYNQSHPDRVAAVEAISQGDGILKGPVELRQGGQGLIWHKPIMASGPAGLSKVWGMLCVRLDYARFMAELGLPPYEEEFDILIREVSSDSANSGAVLAGDLALLDRDPIILDLTFPFGKWEIAVTPDGGWPKHRPDSTTSWIERAAMIAICLIGLWYVGSLLDRRRLAETQLTMGIEALDHGFVMFDADRRLVAFNNKYKQLAGGSGMVKVGARYEDIVKANLEKGLIPDAVGREEEWYAEWSKRIPTKEADKEQILADGRTIRAYDRAMKDGSVVGLRIDITDLKKAQIAAEAANKAKTDFMGVLSHELRTPLTVILGHAQLAKKLRALPMYKQLVAEIEAHPEAEAAIMPKLDVMSDQVTKMMDSLERSGNHLFTLISEILDFAKIDSGTLSIDMEDTSSDEIVAAVADQMRPMVEDKGLDFVINSGAFPIHGDSKRLQQILFNLIGNATKFTDEGAITVDVEQTEEKVIFHVSDSGIGIPEDQVTKVFDAFHQVDSTNGRKYGGTGLGLAISRDIARAHEGDLSATSNVGSGSTFTLTLPRPKAKPTPMLAQLKTEQKADNARSATPCHSARSAA